MTKRLRVVAKGEEGEIIEGGFADAARMAMDKALGDGTNALAIIYEQPDGKIATIPVPFSQHLLRGLILGAHEAVFPDAGDDE